MKISINKIWAWVIGLSLVLLAFRNPLMQLGMIIGAVATVNILIRYGFAKKLSLGTKTVYIPLLIIIGSIIVSSLYRYAHDHNQSLMIGNIFMALYFFSIYLVARALGKEILRPFAWAVVIESVSVVVYSLIINYGVQNGGLASIENYNIATGILVFGAFVSVAYKKWIIVTIAMIGLFFTGSEEGITAVIVLMVVLLIKRDWSKKLLLTVGSVAIIALLGVVPFTYTRTLYERPVGRILYLTGDKTHIVSTYQPPEITTTTTTPIPTQDITQTTTQPVQITTQPVQNNETPQKHSKLYIKMDYVLDGRLTFIHDFITNPQPLGTGYVYYPNNNVDNPIHNVPLIIVEQVGIVAAIAWIFLLVYCMVKTKWKWAFVAVISLCPQDNFMWTRLGIWFFALVGVALVVALESDYIFKDKKVCD